ncbi:MAG: TlpA disulfide reductase family protein [Bacteroidales bacterium]
MKRVLILFFTVLMISACVSDKTGYRINCKIEGTESSLKRGEAYLYSFSQYENISDTAKVVNGKFYFKGKINTPGRVAIRIKNIKGNILLYLENSEYEIKGQSSKLMDVVISGGETQFIISEIAKKSKEGILSPEYLMLRQNFIKKYPLSSFSLEELVEESKSTSDTRIIAKKLSEFKADPRYNNNAHIGYIESQIEKKKKFDPGNLVHDFTMPDQNNKNHTFSDIYKNNKLTMLYFWAGCNEKSRMLNPLLVELYSKYNKKGFEIVAVSLDDIRSEWTNAIRNDKLPGIQLSDLNGTFCVLIPYYDIKSLPQNLFVDNEGKIVIRKVKGDEIAAFLEDKLN